MPDANGKLYYEDFVSELQALGFDGFGLDYLGKIVNRAYFAVAKKSRWEWEKTTDTFTIAPGAYYADLATELPNFRSLERLYKTTTGYAAKMQVMDRDTFFEHWLSLDLTAVSIRAEPSHYFLYDGRLYILSPPAQSREFTAYYTQRPTSLVNPTDQPITPVHLDEAILDAARIRAHTRSNESALAQLAREDLEEQYDDMRDDEERQQEEEPTRVVPDRTWA